VLDKLEVPRHLKWSLEVKAEACSPSTVSASNPEPAPSTVLIAVRISAAVWSSVYPEGLVALYGVNPNAPVTTALVIELVDPVVP
jgi:hypothetical protein